MSETTGMFFSKAIETPFGWTGVVWKDGSVRRLFLPEKNRDSLERRVAGAMADAPTTDVTPPEAFVSVVERMQRYFAGETIAFDDIAVDLARVDGFARAIYDAARELAFGKTTTYGELAARAGHAGMARETGQALGANPVPLIIPCHRILAAGGKIGGFSAPGGSNAKLKMLELEGVRVGPPEPAQQTFMF